MVIGIPPATTIVGTTDTGHARRTGAPGGSGRDITAGSFTWATGTETGAGSITTIALIAVESGTTIVGTGTIDETGMIGVIADSAKQGAPECRGRSTSNR